MLGLRNCIYWCFVIWFTGVSSRKLPPWIDVCHMSDPKLADCVIHNAVDIIQPRLAKGIPELFIPPFDPLEITEIVLNGGAGFKATFTDIKIYNISNFILEDIPYNLEELSFTLNVYFPYLKILSNYKLKGRLLILDLDGSGKVKGDYYDVRGSLKAHCTTFTKKGKTYLKLNKDAVNLNIPKAHLEFDNLFGDNKELNDRTNDLINENIQEILKEIKPVLTEAISAFGFGILDRIYDKYSFQDLFPEENSQI